MRIIGFFLLITVLLYSCASSKEQAIFPRSIADCEGTVPLMQSGRVNFELPSAPGKIDEFKAYPSLQDIPEGNAIWFNFIAPFDGSFTMKAESDNGDIRMIIFKTDPGRDICNDIVSGRAEIVRFLVNNPGKTLSLSNEGGENNLIPLKLDKGDGFTMVVFADARKKSYVSMDTYLEPADKEELVGSGRGVKKIIDERKSDDKPYLHIQVKDVESLQPVFGNLKLEGIRGVNGNYKASDLFLVPNQSGKLNIKCDVEGYFFIDRDEPISTSSNNEVILWLEPLRRGKSMMIEEIQFKPGTSDFLSTAEPKLKRLRDFMVLNSNIHIEIQGHVLEIGASSKAGMALSEARAQKVLNYLVESGINKRRLKAVGFGGTRPVFEKPKFSYEEQANRRVEIVIL